MENAEIAKSSQALSITPIVLPPILAALRTSWNVDSERLRRAGIYNYLFWIQNVTRMAYVDRVIQFVQTYSRETEIVLVDGWTIDFSSKMIERILRLPAGGHLSKRCRDSQSINMSIGLKGNYLAPQGGVNLILRNHNGNNGLS